MKHVLISALFILCNLISFSQTEIIAKNTSVEFNLGLSRVSFHDMKTFNINNVNCCHCVWQTIKDRGFEISTNLLINRAINTKHEIRIGFGLNIWNYEEESISDNSSQSLGIERNSISLFDVIVGNRYNIKELNNKMFFLENLFHGELNTADSFNKIKLSFEPGLGLKFNLRKRLNLYQS